MFLQRLSQKDTIAIKIAKILTKNHKKNALIFLNKNIKLY